MRAVGKNQTGALLVVQRLGHAAGRAEAGLSKRRVPDECVVFADQHIGVTVAVQINEFQVGVTRVTVQARRERTEGLPALVVVMLVQAGHGAIQHHQVGLTISGKVHELGTTGQGEVGLGCNALQRGELDPALADWAQVAFVEPCVSLLGENAGNAFAMQVDPLVPRPVETFRQVLEACCVEFENLILDGCLAVLERERR